MPGWPDDAGSGHLGQVTLFTRPGKSRSTARLHALAFVNKVFVPFAKLRAAWINFGPTP